MRFNNRGKYFNTCDIGFVLCKSRNPKQWEVVLEDNSKHICILPKYNKYTDK